MTVRHWIKAAGINRASDHRETSNVRRLCARLRPRQVVPRPSLGTRGIGPPTLNTNQAPRSGKARLGRGRGVDHRVMTVAECCRPQQSSWREMIDPPYRTMAVASTFSPRFLQVLAEAK